MSTHAPFPPSSAHRWMRCAGSVALTKDMPRTDTIYSREGTFAHGIAAECLTADVDAEVMLGAQHDGFTFTEELAAGVQTYLNVVRGLLFTGEKCVVEGKVALSADVYGTLDAAILSTDKRTLDVVDLKMGAGTFVDAEGNEQLMIYAIGALNEIGMQPRGVEAVRLHIVQPRYFGAEPHRMAAVTGTDLAKFHEDVLRAVGAAKAPNAPLVAGDHCKFCPAKATCPKLQEQALTTAQDLFPTLDPVQPAVAPPLLESLSGEQLSRVLVNVGLARAWLTAVEQHAFKRMVKGETIPGFKLIEKVGNRKWMDDAKAAATLEAHGLNPWAPKKIASPAKVEEQGKAAKAVVAGLTIREVTGVSLVPESHKKPAIAAGAQVLDEFDVLSE